MEYPKIWGFLSEIAYVVDILHCDKVVGRQSQSSIDNDQLESKMDCSPLKRNCTVRYTVSLPFCLHSKYLSFALTLNGVAYIQKYV